MPSEFGVGDRATCRWCHQPITFTSSSHLMVDEDSWAHDGPQPGSGYVRRRKCEADMQSMLAEPEIDVRQLAAASHYVSTYCIHDDHERCRLVCKTCDAPCRCHCHGEDTDAETVGPSARVGETSLAGTGNDAGAGVAGVAGPPGLDPTSPTYDPDQYGTWVPAEFYVCPDHRATHGYEDCCACGGWADDDPDRGRLCSEANE